MLDAGLLPMVAARFVVPKDTLGVDASGRGRQNLFPLDTPASKRPLSSRLKSASDTG